MDNRSGNREHLDATGERKVVFCHQCENEWWQDDYGLVCPRCEGEATEIVEPDHDPRDIPADDLPPLRDLHNHSPWGSMVGGNDSDPEEADIEEHITRGPGGSIMISQTIRSSPVRRPLRSRPELLRRHSSNHRNQDAADQDDPERMLMRQFHGLVQGLTGGGIHPPRGGGRDIEDPFPLPGEDPWGGRFTPPRGSDLPRNRSGSNRGFSFSTHEGPNVFGSRVTFTTGRVGPRPMGAGAGDGPASDFTTLLSNLFGNMAPPSAGDDAPGGARAHPGPPNISALLAALMNPANAASGDAVYTQEALDRVISQLMEAHPTSSAPGPAPPSSISSLPKRALTEKDLEGNKKVANANGVEEPKGECSVCMDDVGVGEEMVFLPCKHWFHEACASAWLSEHDSCPICRKSISPDGGNSNNGTNGSGSGSGGSSSRRSPFRRASSGSRPSIFTAAGRRERRDRERREREAELFADRGAEGLSPFPRLVRRPNDENGSGAGGHSRWTSASSNTSTTAQVGDPSPWGAPSRAGEIFGMGSRTGERTGVSRRYSAWGRAPQRRESDSALTRNRSSSPSEMPMPGAFSPTPPRRDSARSSRSGSGSGSGSGSSGGGSGGVLGWVRDRFPGRRSDAT